MKDYERLTKKGDRWEKQEFISVKISGDESYVFDSKSIDCIIERFNRLAELEDKIEQGTIKEEKTCKNITEMHPVDEFVCSECGFSLVDFVEQIVDEEECDTTYQEYEIKYCPNCGAKVVEELQE